MSTRAAIVAGLSLLIVGTSIVPGTAQQRSNAVKFKGEFRQPIIPSGSLTAGSSAPIDARLLIVNDSAHALRMSTYRSALPELLNAHGTVVAADFGANRSRSPLASDYPLLKPGQFLTISVSGTLTLQDGKLAWRGNDGMLGLWQTTQADAPYRLRLKYTQVQSDAGPFGAGSRVLRGLWTGEAVTDAVPLPLNFAD